MKESVTTLPGSLGVNPPEWTTAHKQIPPEWLSQEGHPCMIGGRHGTMEIVNGRLVCVVSPAPMGSKESSDMSHHEMAAKVFGAVKHQTSQAQGKQSSSWFGNSETTKYNILNRALNSGFVNKGPGSFSHPSGHELRIGSSRSSHSIHLFTRSGVSEALRKSLESNDMNDVITEGTNLRFASPSRTQLVKAYVYFDVRRRQVGLGKVKVSLIQGTQGNWFFDVTSHENNQFLDPGRLNRILPADVTVTSGPGPVVLPQTASQDEIRNIIRKMVEQKIEDPTVTFETLGNGE